MKKSIIKTFLQVDIQISPTIGSYPFEYWDGLSNILPVKTGNNISVLRGNSDHWQL
jgi:hypothetical protein